MTKREGAIVTAATGILCCDFQSFHEYAEMIIGRPIMTHEFGSGALMIQIKAACQKDLLEMIKNQTA